MTKSIQPITGTSASRKPLYIGLIVIALVIVLVLVYFGTKQFAGKAGEVITPETTLAVGQAGITGNNIPSSGNIIIGSTITFDIGANISDASSIAYDFKLQYPADAFRFVSVTPLDSWGEKDTVFMRTTPASGSVTFERANLDYTDAVTGSVPLARVTFTTTRALTTTDYQALSFSSFNVYNLENNANLISATVGGSGGTEIQQCTEAQCRNDFELISQSECTPSTQDQCLTAYTDLILKRNCPAGTVVEDASCTAYYDAHPNDRDAALCGAWLDTLDADDLSADQRTALCASGSTQGFNADLNNDGRINDGDIIIIQLAMLAKESGYATCGAQNEAACAFEGEVYVCEDLTNSYSNSITCGGGS